METIRFVIVLFLVFGNVITSEVCNEDKEGCSHVIRRRSVRQDSCRNGAKTPQQASDIMKTYESQFILNSYNETTMTKKREFLTTAKNLLSAVCKNLTVGESSATAVSTLAQLYVQRKKCNETASTLIDVPCEGCTRSQNKIGKYKITENILEKNREWNCSRGNDSCEGVCIGSIRMFQDLMSNYSTGCRSQVIHVQMVYPRTSQPVAVSPAAESAMSVEIEFSEDRTKKNSSEYKCFVWEHAASRWNGALCNLEILPRRSNSVPYVAQCNCTLLGSVCVAFSNTDMNSPSGPTSTPAVPFTGSGGSGGSQTTTSSSGSSGSRGAQATSSSGSSGSRGTQAISSSGSSGSRGAQATSSSGSSGSGGTQATSSSGSSGSRGAQATSSSGSSGSRGAQATSSSGSSGSGGTQATSSSGSSGSRGAQATSSSGSSGSGGTQATSSSGSSGSRGAQLTSSSGSSGSRGTQATSSSGSSGSGGSSDTGKLFVALKFQGDCKYLKDDAKNQSFVLAALNQIRETLNLTATQQIVNFKVECGSVIVTFHINNLDPSDLHNEITRIGSLTMSGLTVTLDGKVWKTFQSQVGYAADNVTIFSTPSPTLPPTTAKRYELVIDYTPMMMTVALGIGLLVTCICCTCIVHSWYLRKNKYTEYNSMTIEEYEQKRKAKENQDKLKEVEENEIPMTNLGAAQKVEPAPTPNFDMTNEEMPQINEKNLSNYDWAHTSYLPGMLAQPSGNEATGTPRLCLDDDSDSDGKDNEGFEAESTPELTKAASQLNLDKAHPHGTESRDAVSRGNSEDSVLYDAIDSPEANRDLTQQNVYDNVPHGAPPPLPPRPPEPEYATLE